MTERKSNYIPKAVEKEIKETAKKIMEGTRHQCKVEDIVVKRKKPDKNNWSAETKDRYWAIVKGEQYLAGYNQKVKYECEMSYNPEDKRAYGVSWWGVDPCRQISLSDKEKQI